MTCNEVHLQGERVLWNQRKWAWPAPAGEAQERARHALVMCCPDSRVPKHVPASLSYKPCAPVASHSFRTGCCPPKGQVARSQGPNASNARNKKRDQKLRASLQVRVPGLPGSSYIRHLGTAPVHTGADPPRALPPDLHRGSADPARASTARSVLCNYRIATSGSTTSCHTREWHRCSLQG